MANPLKMLRDQLKTTTQSTLAASIGISPQFLSQILNGERNPSDAVLNFLGLEKVVRYRPKPPAA